MNSLPLDHSQNHNPLLREHQHHWQLLHCDQHYGDVNYYSGRSYDKFNKLKYKNPDVSKSDIIFNEGLINWDSNVYLVEGVFDHIVVPVVCLLHQHNLW